MMMALMTVGCATVSPPKTASAPAAHALEEISRWNAGLTSLKGLGSISITSNRGNWRGRFAWVGHLTDHLRASALGPGGRPVLTVIGTPSQTHIMDHHRGDVKRYDSGDRGLSRWIGVPMSPAQLLALLSGRVPFRNADSIQLASEPTTKEMILTAIVSRNTVQRVKWVGNPPAQVIVEMVSPLGKLQWSGRMSHWVQVGDNRFPGQVLITDGSDNQVEIRQDRFWPDTLVTPDMFQP